MADSLTLTNWIGEVINNKDPKNLGRCKIRVYGKFDLLDEETIPWANPMNRDIPGAHAVPRVGDIVAVRFDNGNIYQPEYSFQVNQNPELKGEILDASSAPQDVISIVYDANRMFRLYFSPDSGLVITLGDNDIDRPLIHIDETGDIKISSDSQIFLDAGNIFISDTGPNSKDTSEPAVKGVSLERWLSRLLTDYKNHTHATPSGAPTSFPLPPTPITITQLEQTHPTYQQKK